jgi:hypothetical protein
VGTHRPPRRLVGAGRRAGGPQRRPAPVPTELDLQTVDSLGEQLARTGAELRLAHVRAPALGVLQRSGAAEQIRIAPTLDEGVRQVDVIPPSTGSVTPVT